VVDREDTFESFFEWIIADPGLGGFSRDRFLESMWLAGHVTRPQCIPGRHRSNRCMHRW